MRMTSSNLNEIWMKAYEVNIKDVSGKAEDEETIGTYGGLTPLDLLDGTQHPSGIPMGTTEDERLLMDMGEAHNIVVGSTGSGKSLRVLIPMVLSLAGSEENAIVHDPKGEIFAKTSGALEAAGYKIHVLDFRRAQNSERWNPFEVAFNMYQKGCNTMDMYLVDKSYEVLRNFSSILCPVMESGDDFYWQSCSQNGVFGIMIDLLRRSLCLEDLNLPEVYNRIEEIFGDDGEGFTRPLNPTEIGELEYKMLKPISTNANNTRNCILSYMRNYILPLTLSSTMDRLLSTSDFGFEEFLDGKTIVYIITPDETDTFDPIVSAFISTAYMYLVDASYDHNGKLPYRTNFIIDEFASLPVIPGIAKMLNACRSRNIRMTLVVQSMAQLSKYGSKADDIKGNCNNWIFLGSKDYSTLEEISSLAGKDKNGNERFTVYDLQTLKKSRGEMLTCREGEVFERSHLGLYSDYIDINSLPKPPEIKMKGTTLEDIERMESLYDSEIDESANLQTLF